MLMNFDPQKLSHFIRGKTKFICINLTGRVWDNRIFWFNHENLLLIEC